MLETLNDKTGEQLVRSVVFTDFKEHAKKWCETDDLIGYGFLGLARAINQYDQSRGVKFINFACKKIRHAIIEYLRLVRTKDAMQTLSFQGGDYLDIPHIEKILEQADFIEHLLTCLTKEEEKIIHKVYWDDESEQDIARALNISKTRVHLTKTYAIQKMRDRGNFLLKKGGLN